MSQKHSPAISITQKQKFIPIITNTMSTSDKHPILPNPADDNVPHDNAMAADPRVPKTITYSWQAD